ncbi:MAG: DUF2752 domain-containing protein [Bacteroidota bacterium]|nr:DUF2752 domain-containing protein [Bacteroidota bacterium]
MAQQHQGGVSASVKSVSSNLFFSRYYALAVLVLALVGLGWVYLFDPARDHVFIPCLFHLCTGFSCPGCGMQRAAHSLLHGELRTAFMENPLIFVVFPLSGYLFTSWFVRNMSGRRIPDIHVPRVLLVLAVILVLVYWVVRNFPQIAGFIRIFS